MIRLHLLGSLALLNEDTGPARSLLAQPKRFGVLSYLAVSGSPRWLRGDTLLGMFWPELDEEHARQALRQALYGLRRCLGPGVIVREGDELVSVNGSRLWCDAAAFTVAIQEGRDEEALELYRGSFLEGFHLSGVPAFERWMEEESRRLQLAAVEAAWRLVSRVADNRSEAHRWAQRALELAPFDEEGLRALSGSDGPARSPRGGHPGLRSICGAASVGAGARAVGGNPGAGGADPSRAARRRPRRLCEVGQRAAEAGHLHGDSLVAGLPRQSGRGSGAGGAKGGGIGDDAAIAPDPAPHAPRCPDTGGPRWDPAPAPQRAEPAAPPGHTTYPLTAVAVLPFQDLSADPAHTYFAAGLHDELLTQLSRVTALSLRGRSSVMGYAGTTKPIREIAAELEVGALVEGSVQVLGDRLRVNVQLIDAASDEHLWAESYDGRLEDAFAVQSDIAQRVVLAVGAALGAAERQALADAPTADTEAYLLYLQGREYHRRSWRSRVWVDANRLEEHGAGP